MEHLTKFALPTLIGLLVSLVLVSWVRPNTHAGTMLLVVIVLLASNAIGALVSKKKVAPAAPKPGDHGQVE